MKGNIPHIKEIKIHRAFTKPITIKYEYMVEETSTHYFISVAKRIIGLNKCSVKHNEKEKTMVIISEGY
jgi:hypothetical protein